MDAIVQQEMQWFIADVNLKIKELNQWIHQYNTLTSSEDKISLLIKIYQQHKAMERQYPPSLSGQSLPYRTAFDTLFTEIKEEFEVMQIFSLSEDSLNGKVIETTYSLPEIIANLPSDKANQLYQGLLKATEKQEDIHQAFPQVFVSLYQEGEPGYAKFNAFLGTHAITFLNRGNTINFKVSEGVKEYLFKIELNRTSALSLEADLRSSSLAPALTNVYAERQLPVVNEKAGTMMVTEWCAQGDLIAHSQRHTGSEKIQAALTLYIQMAEALIQLDDEHVCFQDMKNENWLVDATQGLRISDAKSMMRTNQAGEVQYYKIEKDQGNPDNRWYPQMLSPQQFPPEINVRNKEPVQGSAVHAYFLGRNLYQYLTGCTNEYLQKHSPWFGANNESKALEYTHPVFDSAVGPELKELIQSLVREHPKERLSLKAAAKKIYSLMPAEIVEARKNCQELVSMLKTCAFGEKDAIMHRFLTHQEGQIRQATMRGSRDWLQAIEEHLKEVWGLLQPMVKQVKSVIVSLERGIFYKDPKKIAQAQKIHDAVLKIPIEERVDLSNAISEQAKVIQKELGIAPARFKEIKTEMKELKSSIVKEEGAMQDRVSSKPPNP